MKTPRDWQARIAHAERLPRPRAPADRNAPLKRDLLTQAIEAAGMTMSAYLAAMATASPGDRAELDYRLLQALLLGDTDPLALPDCPLRLTAIARHHFRLERTPNEPE